MGCSRLRLKRGLQQAVVQTGVPDGGVDQPDGDDGQQGADEDGPGHQAQSHQDGGERTASHGWSWTLKDNNGESVRFERIKGGGTEELGPITTRSLPWTGGEALKIESAINVEYVQGPENTVVITGPKGLADRVRLEDGRLYLANGDERVVFGWNNGTLSARSERDELKGC